MGFLKKLVKKSLSLDKKVAMRPLQDAKKAIGKANGIARKVGGPTMTARGMTRLPGYKQKQLGMLDDPIMSRRGGGAKPKSPTTRAGGIAPKVSTGGPSRPRAIGAPPRSPTRGRRGPY